MTARSLFDYPVHLGLEGIARAEPQFNGELSWYEAYAERTSGDGADGRLVSLHRFDASWEVWECHPRGAEVVVCVSGAIRLLQESEHGVVTTIDLGPGEYAINPPGVWHTADVAAEATVLFITAGLGTQHRERKQ